MIIPKNFEQVGYNDIMVDMDVDALTRESMIKLFGLIDTTGAEMDCYNDEYFVAAKTNTGLLPENPGAATITKQFIYLESKIMGMLLQMFSTIIKPIQTALELPSILTNPPKLVRKIIDIINSIIELIDSIVEFFTDTLNWFMETLLGPLMNINIPIPTISFNILGIEIKLPTIDMLKKFGKEPYIENLTSQVQLLKAKILETRTKIQSLEDKINPDINAMQVGTIALLAAQISKLFAIDLQMNNEFMDKAYQIHNDVIIEKLKIINEYLLSENTVGRYSNTEENLEFKFNNLKSKLDEYNKFLSNSTQKEKYLNNFNGDETTLINLTDNVLNILEQEELEIEEIINKYGLETNKNFKKQLNILTDKLNIYTPELIELKKEIYDIQTNIDNSKDAQDKMNLAARDFIIGNAAIAGAATIQSLKDDMKKDIKSLAEKSPSSAHGQQLSSALIGLIKAPLDIVIGIITTLIEGIVEFVTELPIPSFEKLKKFFEDLLSLADPTKMLVVISDLIVEISGATEESIQTIERVVNFLPWLFIEVSKTFVLGLASPLPIPL